MHCSPQISKLPALVAVLLFSLGSSTAHAYQSAQLDRIGTYVMFVCFPVLMFFLIFTASAALFCIHATPDHRRRRILALVTMSVAGLGVVALLLGGICTIDLIGGISDFAIVMPIFVGLALAPLIAGFALYRRTRNN